MVANHANYQADRLFLGATDQVSQRKPIEADHFLRFHDIRRIILTLIILK